VYHAYVGLHFGFFYTIAQNLSNVSGIYLGVFVFE
jgi:hypothetical protein